MCKEDSNTRTSNHVLGIVTQGKYSLQIELTGFEKVLIIGIIKVSYAFRFLCAVIFKVRRGGDGGKNMTERRDIELTCIQKILTNGGYEYVPLIHVFVCVHFFRAEVEKSLKTCIWEKLASH